MGNMTAESAGDMGETRSGKRRGERNTERPEPARISVFADRGAATRRPRADKERPATKRNLENEKPISIVERLRKERNTERERNRLPLCIRTPTKRLKGAT